MHLFGPCRTLTFRISMVLLFEIFVIPFAVSTPLIVLSCLVTVKYLSDNLRNLKRLVKIVSKQVSVRSRDNKNYEISLAYRKVQIFTIICYECCTSLVWPKIEFSGSLLDFSSVFFAGFQKVHDGNFYLCTNFGIDNIHTRGLFNFRHGKSIFNDFKSNTNGCKPTRCFTKVESKILPK